MLALYKAWTILKEAFATICPEAVDLFDESIGEPLGYEAGYGPVRLLDTETLRSISHAMSAVGREEVMAAYRENLCVSNPKTQEMLSSKETIDACGQAYTRLSAYLVEAVEVHAFLLKYFT